MLVDLAKEPAVIEGEFKHSWGTAEKLYKSEAIDSFGNRYLLGVFENKADAEKAFDSWNKEYEQAGKDVKENLKNWAKQQEAEPCRAPPQVDSTPAMAAPARTEQVAPEAKHKEKAATSKAQAVARELREVKERLIRKGLSGKQINVLDNTLQNPEEAKFRQLKCSNAALKSKLLDVAGSAGKELMRLAGFKDSADGELLVLDGPPDGKCTSVRERMQAAATTVWEKHAREERDARIKEEIEKDSLSHDWAPNLFFLGKLLMTTAVAQLAALKLYDLQPGSPALIA
eukprot:s1833_g16.t2